MLEPRQIVVFEGKCRRLRILANVQRMIDQFEHKRCQKTREDLSYQLH